MRGLVEKSRCPCRTQRLRWSRSCERRRLGSAASISLHGQAPDARHSLRRGTGTERIHGRANPRQRPAPSAYHALRLLSGSHQRQAPPIFNGHAKRWRYGQRAKHPGELFRSITCRSPGTANNSRSSKPSPPIGKHLVARAYSSATDKNAKRFPEAVRIDLSHDLHLRPSRWRQRVPRGLRAGLSESPHPPPRPFSSTAAWSELTTLRRPSSGISTTATSPWPMPN